MYYFIQPTPSVHSFVHPGVGVDPIIGALAGAQRVISGLDPTDATKQTTLTTGTSFMIYTFISNFTHPPRCADFVVSRGGEYFFSPSLSAIASKLSV
jgi:hypothetical protein